MLFLTFFFLTRVQEYKITTTKMSKWFFTRPFLFDFDSRLGFRRKNFVPHACILFTKFVLLDSTQNNNDNDND